MTDWTEHGAVPVDDAASDDPPTVDEVFEEQEHRDDLPDPAADPEHQQADPDRDLQRALDDQAIANNTAPDARCHVDDGNDDAHTDG